MSSCGKSTFYTDIFISPFNTIRPGNGFGFTNWNHLTVPATRRKHNCVNYFLNFPFYCIYLLYLLYVTKFHSYFLTEYWNLPWPSAPQSLFPFFFPYSTYMLTMCLFSMLLFIIYLAQSRMGAPRCWFMYFSLFK